MKEKMRTLLNLIFCLIGYYLIIYILNTTCLIKWLTGISCAGCGMSRAYLSLLKGDINEAFYYHPLFPLVPIAILIYLIRNKLSKKVYYLLIGLIITAFMICYVIRMADPNNMIVTCNIKESIFVRIIGGIQNVLF